MCHFRLNCDCGFKSNPAPLGESIDAVGYHQPVAVPDDEVLRFVVVVKQDEESEGQYEERLDKSIGNIAIKEFGPGAIAMNGLGQHQKVKCPKCKSRKAVFEFAGF
jgi:hypothetical protein